ncbi:MAG TPA: type II CAAX endopeptidase family protein [Aggregatilineales bacterium]|nr:type II CAAX endopeptidase family protein [Aggregatilineales bacterium]
MFDEASHLPEKRTPPESPPLEAAAIAIVPADSILSFLPQPSAPDISRAWTFFDLLLIFAAAVFVVLLPGALYARLADSLVNEESNEALDWVITMISGVFVFSSLYLTAITLGWLRKRTWSDFGYRMSTLPWLAIGVGLGVLFIPVRMALVFMVAIFIDSSILEESSSQNLLENTDFSLIGVIAATVVVVFLAPLVEELFFRGILYGWLRKRFGIIIGVIVSGLLFGIAHIEPAMIIANSVMGFMLALSYEYSKSLFVPMTIHFVNNFIVSVLVGLALIVTWLS